MSLTNMQHWPEWWKWELEFTPHLFKRMIDRQFNELDLRAMLQNAKEYRRDVIEWRWVIITHHNERKWEIIVEPDESEELLIVITAYPIYGDLCKTII